MRIGQPGADAERRESSEAIDVEGVIAAAAAIYRPRFSGLSEGERLMVGLEDEIFVDQPHTAKPDAAEADAPTTVCSTRCASHTGSVLGLLFSAIRSSRRRLVLPHLQRLCPTRRITLENLVKSAAKPQM